MKVLASIRFTRSEARLAAAFLLDFLLLCFLSCSQERRRRSSKEKANRTSPGFILRELPRHIVELAPLAQLPQCLLLLREFLALPRKPVSLDLSPQSISPKRKPPLLH